MKISLSLLSSLKNFSASSLNLLPSLNRPLILLPVLPFPLLSHLLWIPPPLPMDPVAQVVMVVVGEAALTTVVGVEDTAAGMDITAIMDIMDIMVLTITTTTTDTMVITLDIMIREVKKELIPDVRWKETEPRGNAKNRRFESNRRSITLRII